MQRNRIQPRKVSSVQAGCCTLLRVDKATQTEQWHSTYQRLERQHSLTYDDLLRNYLSTREITLQWLRDDGFIASQRICKVCLSPMSWVSCEDRLDGFRWECRRYLNGKRHRAVTSIRSGSWFQAANLSIEEVLKFTYWWTSGLSQMQIRKQLRLSPNTAVDWDMFCRETCCTVVYKDRQQLGGDDVIVQIDESKIGKRKYHRGHFVEGQWVFGGIEQGSRKCFIECVEKRDEDTLVPLIKQWIRPGTTIYSDCWKGYINLADNGYNHSTVNHSEEYVTIDGVHTNKIEGHWRHMKASLPAHGVLKTHYESYIAEFLWRYVHRGEDLFFAFLADMKRVYSPNDN